MPRGLRPTAAALTRRRLWAALAKMASITASAAAVSPPSSVAAAPVAAEASSRSSAASPAAAGSGSPPLAPGSGLPAPSEVVPSSAAPPSAAAPGVRLSAGRGRGRFHPQSRRLRGAAGGACVWRIVGGLVWLATGGGEIPVAGCRDKRAPALAVIAKALAGKDPAEAAVLLEHTRRVARAAGLGRDRAVCDVAAVVAGFNLEMVVTILKGDSGDGDRSEGMARIAEGAAQTGLDGAEVVARAIPDPGHRVRALIRLADVHASGAERPADRR